MTADGGLSPATRAWLAGAGSRLNEPVREDQREDVQARLEAAADTAVGLGYAVLRAELVAAMKQGYSMHGDGLLANMAGQVLAAGWVSPAGAEALVEAARAETAERIAAAIEAARDGGLRVAPYSNHYNAGVTHAARIARETLAPNGDDR